MTAAYVQFSDSTKTTIISVFCNAQDPSIYPNQGTIDSSDARYISFMNPPATRAAAALINGLAITSVSTPALNGTYACDTLSQMDIIAIETGLNAGKGFPGGVTMFNYPDVAGTMHSFSTANFTNFAAAVRDFVYGCKSVIAGQTSVLPTAAASIA